MKKINNIVKVCSVILPIFSIGVGLSAKTTKPIDYTYSFEGKKIFEGFIQERQFEKYPKETRLFKGKNETKWGKKIGIYRNKKYNIYYIKVIDINNNKYYYNLDLVEFNSLKELIDYQFDFQKENYENFEKKQIQEVKDEQQSQRNKNWRTHLEEKRRSIEEKKRFEKRKSLLKRLDSNANWLEEESKRVLEESKKTQEEVKTPQEESETIVNTIYLEEDKNGNLVDDEKKVIVRVNNEHESKTNQENDFSFLLTKISKLESKIFELESKNSSLVNQKIISDNKVNDYNGVINKLRSEITSLKEKIKSLNNQKIKNNGIINNLRNEINSLESKLENVRFKYNVLKDKIETKKAKERHSKPINDLPNSKQEVKVSKPNSKQKIKVSKPKSQNILERFLNFITKSIRDYVKNAHKKQKVKKVKKSNVKQEVKKSNVKQEVKKSNVKQEVKKSNVKPKKEVKKSKKNIVIGVSVGLITLGLIPLGLFLFKKFKK